MDTVLEFLSANAALLVATVALLISLRANYFAHRAHQLNVRSKLDSDRVLLFEKKRELLNELDRQHAVLATLKFVTAQQIIVFQGCPKLHELLPNEYDRLKNNQVAVENLEKGYERQRSQIASLEAGADIAAQDEHLANVRRLTIHLEKDIAHERALLDEIRNLASTAPGA